MIRLTCVTLCLVALSVSAPAIGDAYPAEVEARTLAWRALELEAQGRCGEAVPLFRKAYNLVPVPTLALFEGRCHERMRQLVEAEARYTAAASFAPSASSPLPLAKAVSEAKQRLIVLRPKVPRLVIEDRAASMPVWLDGREVFGSALPVNPGEHEIAWGTPRRSTHVELSEGEQKHVSLKQAASARDVATYAALGIGVLGIGTGVVTGLMAADKKSEVDDACSGSVCPASASGKLDDYRTLRRISTWSYVTGTVGLGVGGVLILTRPNEREATIVARGSF